MFRRLGSTGEPSAPLLPCRAVSSRAEGALGLTSVSNRSLRRDFGRPVCMYVRLYMYLPVCTSRR